MKALLVLEDGKAFTGTSTTGEGQAVGRLAVNRSPVGYQEIITDSSAAGKIVAFTSPLIGNYGAGAKFSESEKCRASGVITRFESPVCSNWQAESPLNDFLRKHRIPAITGIDTRALAVRVREKGEMLAAISTFETVPGNLLKLLKNHRPKDFIRETSVSGTRHESGTASPPLKIGVLDLGTANIFLAQLRVLGAEISIFPFDTGSEAIIEAEPDALLVSNGPEESPSAPLIAKTVSGLLGRMPVMGISAGAGITWLALGGGLKKLKTAHRGMNCPVRPPDSFKGEITLQDHAFSADPDSTAGNDVRITLINANDGSVESFESPGLKLYGVYYYPMPGGAGEVNEVFSRFAEAALASKCQKEKT